MLGLEKTLWLIVQWEVARSHLQIIFNLRSVSGLRFLFLLHLVVEVDIMVLLIILIKCYISPDSFLWDRQHPCDAG